jgi:hypothetical protein
MNGEVVVDLDCSCVVSMRRAALLDILGFAVMPLPA